MKLEALDTIAQEVRELRSESREIKDAVGRIYELETDFNLHKTRWAGEREAMQREIDTLKRKDERREKLEKIRSLTIDGLVADDDNPKKAIQEFFRNDLQVDDTVEQVYIFKRNGRPSRMVVKMCTEEGKRKVMEAKRILKGRKIFINPDYTEKDSEILFRIRERARLERERGNAVIMGYKRIVINGIVHAWREGEGLVSTTEPQAPRNRNSLQREGPAHQNTQRYNKQYSQSAEEPPADENTQLSRVNSPFRVGMGSGTPENLHPRY